MNPASAWQALRQGNERFVNGTPLHPNQGIADRAALSDGQHPTAVLFGCGDSRVAAEIIFDQGLGDVFVVRTAGHVLDDAVLGSIEYAVDIVNVPLIVVLGHDGCGAVKATLDALDNGAVPEGFIRTVVERVAPSVMTGRREGLCTADELEAHHVVETGALLAQRSRIIAGRIEAGTCAIAGVTYTLSDGRIHHQGTVGDIGEPGDRLPRTPRLPSDPTPHHLPPADPGAGGAPARQGGAA
ncbi:MULTISPECIES: carbonic anhydrase [Rhodococcus]|uniref:Carbonic anhydrase n=2 Tax=Rhodococcus TaxID=1827 RepID=K8XBS8_RHOOP|nr:carbonic anhydrase [Rhodococcus opacus]EKT78874.1 carbonic anhydrase [Rhodococcus opacus M213]MDV6245161.1 carbonic anhydrase [Rhodococcus opacus]MDV7088893.1 carbonic anhydrase [Rhodococcus opacus]